MPWNRSLIESSSANNEASPLQVGSFVDDFELVGDAVVLDEALDQPIRNRQGGALAQERGEGVIDGDRLGPELQS